MTVLPAVLFVAFQIATVFFAMLCGVMIGQREASSRFKFAFSLTVVFWATGIAFLWMGASR